MWRFFVKKQSKIINNVLLKNNINNNIKMWNNNIRINSNNYRFFHSTSFNRYHRFSPATPALSDTNNTVRKKFQYAVEENKTYAFKNNCLDLCDDCGKSRLHQNLKTEATIIDLLVLHLKY